MKATLPDGTVLEGTAAEVAECLRELGMTGAQNVLIYDKDNADEFLWRVGGAILASGGDYTVEMVVGKCPKCGDVYVLETRVK